MAATAEAVSHAGKHAAIMRVNDENPNNCLVVTEMHFEQDSIPTEKSDYTYNANRDVASWFFYQRVDTGWMCTRYEYYDYIFLPNDTTYMTFTHEWNFKAQEWFPVSGFKQQTISNGNIRQIISWQTQDADSTHWIESSKVQMTFNAEGRLLEDISYSWQDNRWVPAFRMTYAYDSKGTEVLRQSDSWVNEAWQIDEKDEILRTDTTYRENHYYRNSSTGQMELINYVYERYDANGNKVLYIWGTGTDRIYQKEEYTYQNGLMTGKSVYKEANYPPYALTLVEQFYYLYDDHNRVNEQKYVSYNVGSIYLVSRLLQTYVSDTSKLIASTIQLDSICYDDHWALKAKNEYTYTPAGSPLLTLKSVYDSEDSLWVYSEKSEYAYNADEQELFSAFYNWDTQRNCWQGVNKHETEYNAEGVAVSSITYFMNEGDTTWIPERAIVRMFDVYGNFLGEGWYGFNSETGELVNLGKQLLVYVCGDIPTPAQPVVVEPGHDFVTFAWLSYEDANTYKLTILSASQTDTIAIMNFNSFGELINQTVGHSPNRASALPSSSSVFTCLIEGLETATQYVFIMEAKSATEQVLHTQQGNFNTEGYVSALESVPAKETAAEKLLMNGSLIIRCGEKYYTPQGQQLR